MIETGKYLLIFLEYFIVRVFGVEYRFTYLIKLKGGILMYRRFRKVIHN